MSDAKQKMMIQDVQPAVFLRQGDGGLEQLARVSLDASGDAAGADIVARAAGREVVTRLGPGPEHEVYVPELEADGEVEFELRRGEDVADTRTLAWKKPKRWTVHLVHVSHHDAGYTDLYSNVLKVHDQYLADVLEMAAATRDFPEEAQFRCVIEQVWSLLHFLRTATPAQTAKMVELLRSGHVELTALLGNLVTELCGHETLVRAAYPAFALKRQYGIPIISAEHNDVPGFSWGLAQVLTGAGIKIFIPRLPFYWSWGEQDLQSFWDQDAIFPEGGPGAFWWEAPSHARILLWCNNQGYGGGCRASLPGLADRLEKLASQGWRYDTIRWPVGGGARDNSPYIDGYTSTVRDWNAKWAWPRLMNSTNARFYRHFAQQLPPDLPVFRGELPGQDYPVGATSTARATALNRNNHSSLLTAERLASAAALATDYEYPAQRLAEANEFALMHDEHTWGHHFPCGPTAATAELEKALHAHRAATFAHDVINQALARIADHVQLAGEGFHLVVFNSLPYPRTGVVHALLREIDNCGSTMFRVEDQGEPFLRGVLLQDRWHANPPPELIEGRFELIDLAAGEPVPFQIDQIDAPDEALPYASQRFGLGSGGKRYGAFELPLGLKHTLRFVASNVPACGYKTYRLAPCAAAPEFTSALTASNNAIENEYYRVEADPDRGAVLSIFDKTLGRELLDPDAPHGFGSLVVRDPDSELASGLREAEITVSRAGPVRAALSVRGSILGHPHVCLTVALEAGQRRVELAVRILKDPTPLLDVHLAFPFKLEAHPRFRYEGGLSTMTPIEDYFPGAYSDALAIQNWVRISDAGLSVLWSSLEAPVAGLGGLWPGYVSPAHRAAPGSRLEHPPLRPEDLRHGWLYANLFSNNFGTNFGVSQSGDFLFRFVLASGPGQMSDAEAAAFGWDAVTPFAQIFTKHERPRALPVQGSFLELDNPQVVLLTWKQAEDGHGWILRLWNIADSPAATTVSLPALELNNVTPVSLVEEDLPGAIPCNQHSFQIELEANQVATFRLCPVDD